MNPSTEHNAQPTMPSDAQRLIQVTYFPGITVYGSLPGLLELTDKGTLKLVVAEGTQAEPVYREIFDVPLTDIKKVFAMLDSVSIKTEQKTYRVSVSQLANLAIPLGGVAGMAVSQVAYAKTGAKVFLQTIKDRGVKMTRIGYRHVWAIALLAGIVFFGGIMLTAFLLGEL